MSLPAKITFALCCATSASIIFYVHYQQEAERKQLEIGVERDIQRQERNKLKSLLKQQTQLTDQLRESSKNEQNLQTL
ncbi:cytochrome c oxidase assembly factor-like [Apis mellifera]|uniref:Cytochrome c oxidase assembly factor-like n=1 Tax=Apis mellifera TaxID=7460 RepID=A0A7M6UD86_APIME|nr:cytochrome c oxidase assembly factor-like [Apis mellifera]|eukprot:NP_001158281.1 cytochrome c oxidase assembly factor-like [Apis mellifera]